uniref:Uncharacterized protein n=1 Tax=Anguilla anguilla TaxID=7936 RepID=A0A0E9UHC1_ANGAN
MQLRDFFYGCQMLNILFPEENLNVDAPVVFAVITCVSCRCCQLFVLKILYM